eukprot:CAMPEP_0114504544 /NCGR_PEP_ID=MMETSP0109-20121206/10294_1 /TAXON_ID=29199 /ORGANISM="Chlorarachnion reptans, Strain CCCM449" /LENGTH=83 /DNA_ID=CAMNT_0001682759 /DNA_START=232 /DNA_END=480 /DNA_ORIENTATION=+
MNPGYKAIRTFLVQHGLTSLGTEASEVRNLILRITRAQQQGRLNMLSFSNSELSSLPELAHSRADKADLQLYTDLACLAYETD